MNSLVIAQIKVKASGWRDGADTRRDGRTISGSPSACPHYLPSIRSYVVVKTPWSRFAAESPAPTGMLTGKDREHAEVSMLALHLLHSSLVYVNTPGGAECHG
jgi:hypothetical protein